MSRPDKIVDAPYTKLQDGPNVHINVHLEGVLPGGPNVVNNLPSGVVSERDLTFHFDQVPDIYRMAHTTTKGNLIMLFKTHVVLKGCYIHGDVILGEGSTYDIDNSNTVGGCVRFN